MRDNINTVKVWNIKFNLLTKQEIVDFVQDMLASGRKGIHLTGVNPETVVDAQKYEVLRQAINESDLVNIDNMLVLKTLRRQGFDAPERCATPDIFEMLLSQANEKSQRVYFLGAQEEILQTMLDSIKLQYPHLVIAGARNGFFKAEQEKEIVEEIASCNPDYLFIALPSPKKESFILRYKNVLNAGVCYGVGGAFDCKGGKVKRAPSWACNLGLEGLVRVLQNPGDYGNRVIKYYPEFFRIVRKQK